MDVAKIAKLANLNITREEEKKFGSQFEATIKVINELKKLKTDKVSPTSQVTGLANVWREDEVDLENALSQEEALSQAKNSRNGFFVVKKILDKRE